VILLYATPPSNPFPLFEGGSPYPQNTPGSTLDTFSRSPQISSRRGKHNAQGTYVYLNRRGFGVRGACGNQRDPEPDPNRTQVGGVLVNMEKSWHWIFLGFAATLIGSIVASGLKNYLNLSF
jgi:hypothetical protein